MCTIRPTRKEDIPTIREIYNYYVLNSTYTPEIVPPTLDEATERHEGILSMDMPHFVAEVDGTVIGYAHCTPFHARNAYQFTASSAIYLEKNMHGRGYGRQLLDVILREAESFGFRKILAHISDPSNTKSIRLHQSAGFTLAGTFQSCGWKFNRWLNLIVLEKSLGEGDTTPPE